MIPEILELIGVVEPLATVVELGIVLVVGKQAYDIAHAYLKK